MKKRILALILSVFMLAFSGCGGNNNQPQTETTVASTTIEPTTEETTVAPTTVEPTTEKPTKKPTTAPTTAEPTTKKSENKKTENKQPATKKPENNQPATQKHTEAPPLVNYEDELFAKLNSLPFIFTSGVGAWRTSLNISSDGSFYGEYMDSDMGDRETDYPKGTTYFCSFSGQFTDVIKVNDYTYSMRMSYIDYKYKPNTEEIKNGIRYKYSEAYGLSDGYDFIVYMPNAPIQNLPKEFLSWIFGLDPSSSGSLGYYGIYNANTTTAFVARA